MMIIIIIAGSFSYRSLLVVFHWNPSNIEFPYVSFRTVLSIHAYLSSAVDRMVPILTWISSALSLFSWFFGIFPSTSTMINITDVFSSLVRSRYLFSFCFTFLFFSFLLEFRSTHTISSILNTLYL